MNESSHCPARLKRLLEHLGSRWGPDTAPHNCGVDRGETLSGQRLVAVLLDITRVRRDNAQMATEMLTLSHAVTGFCQSIKDSRPSPSSCTQENFGRLDLPWTGLSAEEHLVGWKQ